MVEANLSMKTSASLLVGIGVLAGFVVAGTCPAGDLELSLKNGSVVTVEADDPTIEWTEFAPDGRSLSQSIDLSRIQRLELAQKPAGREIAYVRHLLHQLGSDSYNERVVANRQLLLPEIGGKYISLLRDHPSTNDFEVRYRLRQILAELKELKVEPQEIGEFDRLTLNETSSVGDARDFRLACRFRGKPVEFRRRDLDLIRSVGSIVTRRRPVAGPIEVTLYSDFEKEFFRTDQTRIDFETTPSGEKLKPGDEVTRSYVPVGLRFDNEPPQRIGVSRFAFQFEGSPARGNSICVVTSKGRFDKSFVGEMKFGFCMPGQASVSAGVHELGMFIARVNHPRDFIMECYDTDGNVLGGVEASGLCAFMGIKSTKPIARVRIRSNPYLFRLNRRVDEDYAVDHVCYSKPVPVNGWVSQVPTVHLTQGDVLIGDRIQISSNQVAINIASIDQTLSIPWADVSAVHFSRSRSPSDDPPANESGAWLAMLDDGSVLAVRPGVTMTSELFGGLSIPPNELVALWQAPNEPRLPCADDFEKGSQVLVYPTCRLATPSVQFSAEEYAWREAKLIQQRLQHLDPKSELTEDPNPTAQRVVFRETSIQDTPTLWSRKPSMNDPRKGQLRLTDGQKLVLARPNGFRIATLDSTSVDVEKNGVTQSFDWDQITSLRFPTTLDVP